VAPSAAARNGAPRWERTPRCSGSICRTLVLPRSARKIHPAPGGTPQVSRKLQTIEHRVSGHRARARAAGVLRPRYPGDPQGARAGLPEREDRALLAARSPAPPNLALAGPRLRPDHGQGVVWPQSGLDDARCLCARCHRSGERRVAGGLARCARPSPASEGRRALSRCGLGVVWRRGRRLIPLQNDERLTSRKLAANVGNVAGTCCSGSLWTTTSAARPT
jgi:hypothetical protein